jgi:hypothetical protein
VPTNHGLRPDDGQRIYNAGSEAIQPNEHQPVEGPENKSLRGLALQHINLLPENQDFRRKPHSSEIKLVSAVHSSRERRPSGMSITPFVPLANRIEFPTRTGGLARLGSGHVIATIDVIERWRLSRELG